MNGADFILAPSQALLQMWLRDVHEMWVYVQPKLVIDQIVWINNTDLRQTPKDSWATYHTTYEKALEAGLTFALKELGR